MDVSQVASLSMYMSQASLLQNVGTAVLDMSLDQGASQAEDMIATSLEALANPYAGQNIDIAV